MATLQDLLLETPEVRYAHFLKTVARRGEVWTLASEVGYTTMESDGRIMLVLFPSEKSAGMFSEGICRMRSRKTSKNDAPNCGLAHFSAKNS